MRSSVLGLQSGTPPRVFPPATEASKKSRTHLRRATPQIRTARTNPDWSIHPSERHLNTTLSFYLGSLSPFECEQVRLVSTDHPLYEPKISVQQPPLLTDVMPMMQQNRLSSHPRTCKIINNISTDYSGQKNGPHISNEFFASKSDMEMMMLRVLRSRSSTLRAYLEAPTSRRRKGCFSSCALSIAFRVP